MRRNYDIAVWLAVFATLIVAWMTPHSSIRDGLIVVCILELAALLAYDLYRFSAVTIALALPTAVISTIACFFEESRTALAIGACAGGWAALLCGAFVVHRLRGLRSPIANHLSDAFPDAAIQEKAGVQHAVLASSTVNTPSGSWPGVTLLLENTSARAKRVRVFVDVVQPRYFGRKNVRFENDVTVDLEPAGVVEVRIPVATTDESVDDVILRVSSSVSWSRGRRIIARAKEPVRPLTLVATAALGAAGHVSVSTGQWEQRLKITYVEPSRDLASITRPATNVLRRADPLLLEKASATGFGWS